MRLGLHLNVNFLKAKQGLYICFYGYEVFLKQMYEKNTMNKAASLIELFVNATVLSPKSH